MTVVEESIPPEKLSQEAFRLLRTIQSLLNTREPDLARLSDHEHSSSDNRDSTSVSSYYLSFLIFPSSLKILKSLIYIFCM